MEIEVLFQIVILLNFDVHITKHTTHKGLNPENISIEVKEYGLHA